MKKGNWLAEGKFLNSINPKINKANHYPCMNRKICLSLNSK